MFKDDFEFIKNKYHISDKEFNPYARMSYHGYDFDKSTGLEDEEIKEGLLNQEKEIVGMPHPVAKAYAVKYVLDNTKIDINEHDWFIGLWSVNRLANFVTFDKWYKEIFDGELADLKDKMNDMNESGAVSIWPDFDHVVPDWSSVLDLGFSGIVKRAEFYKEKFNKKGELSPDKKAFFDGIIIEYNAIIDLIDRMYKYALCQKHKKAKK